MAETPANPPRQWTPAKVEGRGAHAPQHHPAEWAPQIWRGPLALTTVPLPTGARVVTAGGAVLQPRSGNRSSHRPAGKQRAVYRTLSSPSLTGTLRPPCEVSRVGGDLSSDSQIEEREAQEDEVTALGPPSWGRPGHSPSLRGSRGGGPQLERLWPKPQLARLGKPVLKQACVEVHGCVHSGWEHGTCMHRGVCTGVGNPGEACERMRRSPASAMPTLKSCGVGLIHLSIHSSNIF